MPSALILIFSTRLSAVCAVAIEVCLAFCWSENVVVSIPKIVSTAASATPSIGKPLSSSIFETAAAVPLP